MNKNKNGFMPKQFTDSKSPENSLLNPNVTK